MDPITTAILAALAVGVSSGATEVGKKLIVDAYDALKAALKKKCGVESDVVEAVEKLEEDPESKARQAVVGEEVADAKLLEDLELTKLAQALMDALQNTLEGKQAVSKYNIQAENSEIGVIGDNADIKGGIHFGSKK